MGKKFWTLEDYESAIHKIRYVYRDEVKPSYSTPDKVAVFKKLVDLNNLKVILEDEELGVNYKAEFAEGMFQVYKDMRDSYHDVNREDKFVYPQELVEVLHFGLYLQLFYIDLGNKVILRDSDNPNSFDTQRVIKHNEQVAVSNYNLYLDYVKQEESFSNEALALYISGLEAYFPKFLTIFPDIGYGDMIKKTKDMRKRAKSPELTEALDKLLISLEPETETAG